jgi:hypothetical protein
LSFRLKSRRSACPAFGPLAQSGELLAHQFAQRHQIIEQQGNGEVGRFIPSAERFVQSIDEQLL